MAAASPFKIELASIAKGKYGSLNRGDPVLCERIEKYCRDVRVAMTAPVEQFHYSTVFISWCMRNAGASEQEFLATAAHCDYAKRAIGKAPGGILRARTIDSYAPHVGDIVHVNREGGTIDYKRAEGPSRYPAESGIVIEVREGNLEVVIVMGNQEPRGTVGTETLASAESGLLLQRAIDPIICVLEVVN